jgi:hypothetical protein
VSLTHRSEVLNSSEGHQPSDGYLREIADVLSYKVTTYRLFLYMYATIHAIFWISGRLPVQGNSLNETNFAKSTMHAILGASQSFIQSYV